MALGVFPVIVRAHYVAVSRVTDAVSQAVKIRAPIACLEIIFAVAGARVGGLIGVSAGWMLALCIEAVIMYPPIHRVLRSPVLDVTSTGRLSTNEKAAPSGLATAGIDDNNS